MHIPGFFCWYEDMSKNVDFFYEIGYNKIYVRKFAVAFWQAVNHRRKSD